MTPVTSTSTPRAALCCARNSSAAGGIVGRPSGAGLHGPDGHRRKQSEGHSSFCCPRAGSGEARSGKAPEAVGLAVQNAGPATSISGPGRHARNQGVSSASSDCRRQARATRRPKNGDLNQRFSSAYRNTPYSEPKAAAQYQWMGKDHRDEKTLVGSRGCPCRGVRNSTRDLHQPSKR